MIVAVDTMGAGSLDVGAGASVGEVTTAFALGWQMAELYQPAAGESAPDGQPRSLPVVGGLAAAERRALRFDQIDAALARLGGRIDAAGLTAPTTKGLRRVPDRAVQRGRNAILAMHTELSRVLTGADFRLDRKSVV